MSNFEKEYYFIKRGHNDSLPTPRPFHETEELEYETKPLPPGAPRLPSTIFQSSGLAGWAIHRWRCRPM